jgi:hypothetical protein
VTGSNTAPYGVDPVFKQGTSLYNPDFDNLASTVAYYNCSQLPGQATYNVSDPQIPVCSSLKTLLLASPSLPLCYLSVSASFSRSKPRLQQPGQLPRILQLLSASWAGHVQRVRPANIGVCSALKLSNYYCLYHLLSPYLFLLYLPDSYLFPSPLFPSLPPILDLSPDLHNPPSTAGYYNFSHLAGQATYKVSDPELPVCSALVTLLLVSPCLI